MPRYNAHQITREFEKALCEYTGAPYAVAVTSCTMALLLAVAWHLRSRRPLTTEVLTSTGHHAMAFEDIATIEIPKRTYVSVPMSIIHAGGRPTFRDEEWRGAYRLKPLPIYDSARWFTGGMFHEITWLDAQTKGTRTDSLEHLILCVSFHTSKVLADTQGGAILHDDPEADKWLRRARFDGRTEGFAPNDDTFDMIGWHCYMSPDVAARLLWKLSVLPKHNEPLPNDDYPDLSQMQVFR